MEPRFNEIFDEDIVRDAPRMRYLIADRYEMIWAVCLPHLDGSAPRPDHRYVETGARVLRELSRLYRLDAPTVAAPGETAPEDTAMMVEAALRELEERSG